MRSTFSKCSHHISVADAAGQEIGTQHLACAHSIYLLVRGMGCPGCAMRVRTALLSVKGVLTADVLLEQGVALIRYDPEQVNLDDLPRAVQGAGESDRHHYSAKLLNGWA
jgi:copper chaperone CopZ